MSRIPASGQAMPAGPPPGIGAALPGVGPADLVQGPIFVGFVVKVLLQGMIFVQAYIYYSRYPKDRFLMKAVVGLLVFADMLNIIFNTMYLYDAFVIHFMDPLYLTKTNWLFATDPILNGVTACTAQLFFAWRIQVLTKQLWVVILVCLFAIGSCCGAFGCAIGSIILGSFQEFTKLKSVLITWLAGSVLADVLIAVTLTWHLKTHKTGSAPTDRVIDRIILITLPTGLLQATVAVLDLVLCFALPPPNRASGVQFIFNYVLSKLFTNSVLSGLNARERLKHDATEEKNISHASGSSFEVPPRLSGSTIHRDSHSSFGQGPQEEYLERSSNNHQARYYQYPRPMTRWDNVV